MFQRRASMIKWNGVSAAVRIESSPADLNTFSSRRAPPLSAEHLCALLGDRLRTAHCRLSGIHEAPDGVELYSAVAGEWLYDQQRTVLS